MFANGRGGRPAEGNYTSRVRKARLQQRAAPTFRFPRLRRAAGASSCTCTTRDRSPQTRRTPQRTAHDIPSASATHEAQRRARPADKRKRRGASCVAALRGWQLNQVRRPIQLQSPKALLVGRRRLRGTRSSRSTRSRGGTRSSRSTRSGLHGAVLVHVLREVALAERAGLQHETTHGLNGLAALGALVRSAGSISRSKTHDNLLP